MQESLTQKFTGCIGVLENNATTKTHKRKVDFNEDLHIKINSKEPKGYSGIRKRNYERKFEKYIENKRNRSGSSYSPFQKEKRKMDDYQFLLNETTKALFSEIKGKHSKPKSKLIPKDKALFTLKSQEKVLLLFEIDSFDLTCVFEKFKENKKGFLTFEEFRRILRGIHDFEYEEEEKQEEQIIRQNGRKDYGPKRNYKITVPECLFQARCCSAKDYRTDKYHNDCLKEGIDRSKIDDLELSYKFKANPLPISNFKSNFQERMERKLEQNRRKHKEEFGYSPNRFSSLSKPKKEYEVEVIQPVFKAHPVPWYCKVPIYTESKDRMEDERRQRIALRSRELLMSSSIPKSMQNEQHTKKQSKYTPLQNCTFQPQITPCIPDFEYLQASFARKLEDAKSTKKPTQSEPFVLSEARRNIDMEWMDTENQNKKKEFRGMVERNMKERKEEFTHYAKATRNYLQRVDNPLSDKEIIDSAGRFMPTSPIFQAQNLNFGSTFKAHELNQLRDPKFQGHLAAQQGIPEYADIEDED